MEAPANLEQCFYFTKNCPENAANKTTLKRSTVTVKDTVLVSLRVPRRSGHIEQHQSGLVGLVDDDLVEFDSSVHPPDIGVVTGGESEAVNELLDKWHNRATASSQLTVSC